MRSVALLFGGRSSEHSISCATAGGVLSALDREQFRVIPIGITGDGGYVVAADDPSRFALDPARMPEVIDNGTRIVWPTSAGSRELRVQDATGERSLGEVDVVFPILHGRFGEDGTIQGMLELLGLPYVGNGVLASAVGMDKHVTKTMLVAAGIAVAPWVALRRTVWRSWQGGPPPGGGGAPGVALRRTVWRSWQEAPSPVGAGASEALSPRDTWMARVHELGLPVFVKPTRAGSSVGVTKVTDWDEFDAAVESAFAEDESLLVEQGIVGRELECAVLQDTGVRPPRVSIAGEVVMTGGGFYDFEAKYLDAPGVDLVCPADLDSETLTQMQTIAAAAFTAIGGEGLARVDMFLSAGGFVVNEINTMPGFTPISMFPRCWQESGVSYPDLLAWLIDLAVARGAR